MVQTTQAQQQLEGTVERLTYHSPATGFTVAKVNCGKADLQTVTGKFASIAPGQHLRFLGVWTNNPTHGRQFQAERAIELRPATLVGIEKYLGSGLIKGIGPATARRIVDRFGLETLDIIESDIRRLAEVPGIGSGKVEMIAKTWEEQRVVKDVMMFLNTHGVSPTYAAKIFKLYGQDAIAKVSANPYQLADDITGIGFLMADRIAREMDIPHNSDFRFASALLYVLNEAAGEGDCYLPEADLFKRAIEILTLDLWKPTPDQLRRVMLSLAEEKKLELVPESKRPDAVLVYLPTLYHAEAGTVKHLSRLLQREIEVDLNRVHSWIDRYTATTGKSLNAEQRQAVEYSTRFRVLVISGGPGTGKSFTSGVITKLWKAMGKTLISLASPTGRAAQRLSEMSNMPASTIHRLLEYSTSGFKRNQHNPLDSVCILIDETSMVDIFLAHSLLRAIDKGAQVLFVGDVCQLPSVGPGAFLRDVIQSGTVPVVMLNEVHRQAAGSLIITNSHAINHGKAPELIPYPEGLGEHDFLFLPANTPEEGVAAIAEIVKNDLPRLGFSPRRDLQILSLMLKGQTGVRSMNPFLQNLLNPATAHKRQLERGGTLFREGDRVIQMRNNYDMEVFNGDVGEIELINPEESELIVKFAEKTVKYDAANLDELQLAYSITVHRSQGSEYPVVIMPMFTESFIMLSRNLCYTGVTRARKVLILVGQTRAINIAVREVKDRKRNTRVADLLKQGLPQIA